MTIFDRVIQGSPDWHELRRGLATCSGFENVLTAVKAEPSKSMWGYACDLAADVGHLSPTWFCEDEGRNKPPNKAMMHGLACEPEARKWLEFQRDCNVRQVGGVLSDCGRFWCSPDGLLVTDSGELAGGLELKCPQLHTQARYVTTGKLPDEYKQQVHGALIVTGLPRWTFLSYAPGLPPLLVEVMPDEYTEKLRVALEEFWDLYLDVLVKLGLRERFHQQRQSVLAHHQEVAS